MTPTKALVDDVWLIARLTDPKIRILDASWYLPSANRDAAAEFAGAHIPGAGFFSIDAISDRSVSLPHMLPSPEAFAGAVGALGISNDDHVVVYDGAGLLSAPRAWWTFRVFGHDRVSVLNGGLPRWRAAGRPVEAGPPAPVRSTYVARFRPELVTTLTQMQATTAQIVDARSSGRFEGTAPEPRPGLRGGHIPNSANLPFSELIDGGMLKDPDALRAAFAALKLDLASPIVTTCGSGLTAAILALALFELGQTEVAVYDGSWTEWASRDDTPVATGP